MAEATSHQAPLPLAKGSTVGPYQIVSLLGAGAMGEVYRAHDPRLSRDVALKVLPAEAALNHPNIVGIYDVGQSPDQPLFIASELIEAPDGKTKQGTGLSNAIEMTFSKDARRLYGIRKEKGLAHLFSLDLATKQSKAIGDLANDFVPLSYLGPGMRLSLSPDGKSILYPVFRPSASLWMLEGFE